MKKGLSGEHTFSRTHSLKFQLVTRIVCPNTLNYQYRKLGRNEILAAGFGTNALREVRATKALHLARVETNYAYKIHVIQIARKFFFSARTLLGCTSEKIEI